jgi:hypothetical protein
MVIDFGDDLWHGFYMVFTWLLPYFTTWMGKAPPSCPAVPPFFRHQVWPVWPRET